MRARHCNRIRCGEQDSDKGVAIMQCNARQITCRIAEDRDLGVNQPRDGLGKFRPIVKISIACEFGLPPGGCLGPCGVVCVQCDVGCAGDEGVPFRFELRDADLCPLERRLTRKLIKIGVTMGLNVPPARFVASSAWCKERALPTLSVTTTQDRSPCSLVSLASDAPSSP